MKKLVIIYLLAAIYLNAQESSNNLTIYNGGFSVVKTNTNIKLYKGINNIVFKDFSEQIEANSLNLDIKAKQLEKSFININPDIMQLLRNYIDNDIKIANENSSIEGTLINIDNGIIIKTKDNKYVIINDINKYNIFLNDLLLDLNKKREFVFKVESNKESTEPAQFTYITNGLGWSTDYVAYIDKSSTKLNLEGWVNLRNNTGINFENTSIKLMAGEIQKNREYAANALMSKTMNKSISDEQNVEANSFSDMYSYNYPNKINLQKNEFKQLPLISKQGINIINKYYYYSNNFNSESNINIAIEINNSEKNGLGIPIPQGNIRIFKQDGDTYELIGNNTINQTAKDEILRIQTGSSFDLIGKSELLETTKISDKSYIYIREITLKNKKNEDVNINVVAYLGRGFEIINSDEKYTTENSDKINLDIKVAKNSEKKFKIKYKLNF